jgi:serine/threonine-protein phosphatase 2B catalytic subunit
MKMVKILREENEVIVRLKGLCPDNKIPRGLLVEGHEALASVVSSFKTAKKWDSMNEKMP